MIKKLLIVALLNISINSYASDTDQILSDYIKIFQFKPLKAPSNFNQEVYDLGKELFFEKLVSGNKNISCSTCHHPDLFSGDALPLSVGEGGVGLGQARRSSRSSRTIARNSPALYNLGHDSMNILFWDGRVSYRSDWDEFTTPAEVLNGEYPEREDITKVLGSALAAQALFPPLSHDEMRGKKGTNDIANAPDNQSSWKIIMQRLLSKQKYKDLFSKAFKGTSKFNIGHFGNALAHFQKHEFSAHETPWDNYLNGDLDAMSESQKRGALLFMTEAQCTKCHLGDLLGGDRFESIASPQIGPGKDIRKNDEGRFLITKNEKDLYQFRVPPLRNVALTGPYFHSGAYDTLEKVVDHYIEGARSIDNYDSRWLSNLTNVYSEQLFVETDRYMNFKKKNAAHPLVRSGVITLSTQERRDLLNFLKYSLTDKKLQRFIK
ncbi:cytochrome-c peroxidase [Halobacteriovorax sp. HLS]|uniref:cytochrome-c peroxidase n=1 Tax=Halobacteriovorax sp. HLS TaxID=2234000 RepID=UPI000FD8D659|nr:cytochrome c peroxidase [Halobacteriovorax sp. HLS]